jgi:cytochrome oxidase Cu insertion factor (SCO1/SenC/PrrC family)
MASGAPHRMMRRPVLVALLVGSLAVAGGATAALSRSHAHAAPLHGDAVWAAAARPAPAFVLHESSGGRFSLAGQRGRVVALTFLSSACRALCPLVGRSLMEVSEALPASERPELVVVSVDPKGDTRASVQRAVHRLGTGVDVRWLVGTHAQLARVWRAYGVEVRPVPGDIEHTTVVYLIDRRGDERVGALFPFSLPGLKQDERELAREEET